MTDRSTPDADEVEDREAVAPDEGQNSPGVRHRLRTHRTIGPIYRIVILVVGLAVIAAGVAMLVLPGPGWAAIILGLVILAPDFVWAERTLAPVKRFADAAAERALDPKHRRLNLILLGVAAVVGTLAVAGYLYRYGVTLEPFPFI